MFPVLDIPKTSMVKHMGEFKQAGKKRMTDGADGAAGKTPAAAASPTAPAQTPDQTPAQPPATPKGSAQPQQTQPRQAAKGAEQGQKGGPQGQQKSGQGAGQRKGQQGPQGQNKPKHGDGQWLAQQKAKEAEAQKAAQKATQQDAQKPKWTPPPVRNPAPPARMRRRHWGLILSFFLLVAAPLAGVCYYLFEVAEDQFASTTGFTVRKEESTGASDLLGGLSQLTGATGGSDGEILYEFILSQALVRMVEEEVGLTEHYTALWDVDPAFALWPDPTIEDLVWYWERVVRISYDAGSGLIDLRVLAFDPDKAQQIAQEIVRRSQEMINALNEQSRADAMRYANADLAEAVGRLKEAREALTGFRTRTQIVDPEADIQGRMGVMNNLQQQLAEALIEFDLLLETTNTNDPRMVQARRRIEVIRARIIDERRSFATEGSTAAPQADDYPTLIAEFEGLVVDREFAEESYRAALAALDQARAKAERQSRYLATYITPTRAESAEFPQRFTIAGIAALFLLLGWSVMALVYYSVRDRG